MLVGDRNYEDDDKKSAISGFSNFSFSSSVYSTSIPITRSIHGVDRQIERDISFGEVAQARHSGNSEHVGMSIISFYYMLTQIVGNGKKIYIDGDIVVIFSVETNKLITTYRASLPKRIYLTKGCLTGVWIQQGQLQQDSCILWVTHDQDELYCAGQVPAKQLSIISTIERVCYIIGKGKIEDSFFVISWMEVPYLVAPEGSFFFLFPLVTQFFRLQYLDSP